MKLVKSSGYKKLSCLTDILRALSVRGCVVTSDLTLDNRSPTSKMA